MGCDVAGACLTGVRRCGVLPFMKHGFLLIISIMPLFGAGLGDLSVEELKERCAKDDLAAKVELAARTYEGEVMPFDQAFVLKAFTRGAGAGIPRALTGLADCHAMGIGMERDDSKVVALLEKAADAGDPLGIFRLGICYFDGRNVPRDPAKGLAMIRKASAAGCLDADAVLARFALMGIGMEKDTAGGLAQLKSLAEERGNAQAAVILGQFHQGMIDAQVKKDPALARRYYLLAAEKNHAAALVALGSMAENNAGKDKEKRKAAADWYRRAIARNSPSGMRMLAKMQMRDTLVRKPGEDWYQMLLDADRLLDDSATIMLAQINYHAAGYFFRDLDWTKTAHFHESLIERHGGYDMGHQSTHMLLEIYYEGGHGLDRDLAKCIRIAQPLLDSCDIANIYAGRVLLHPDLPLGATREHIVRGYACLLKGRAIRKELGADAQGHIEITDDALFVLRSRHGMTREEVSRAERLFREGFPNSKTPLLP